MREPPPSTQPALTLSDATQQFASWRRLRQRGARIPPELWASALRLARKHGVSKVSQALHLDYYAVQRKLAEDQAQEPDPAAEQFVEVALPFGSSGDGQCRLELRARDGRALRLELAVWSVQNLAIFVQAIAGHEP